MSSAKVIFASMSGNTEKAAQYVCSRLNDADFVEAELVCIDDGIMPSDLADTDAVVFATYTYGRGEMPDECVDFFEALADADLTGKIYGVIGTGDTAYDYYCKSADDFEEQFDATGAVQATMTLKIENEPDDSDEERLDAFADAIAAAI